MYITGRGRWVTGSTVDVAQFVVRHVFVGKQGYRLDPTQGGLLHVIRGEERRETRWGRRDILAARGGGEGVEEMW